MDEKLKALLKRTLVATKPLAEAAAVADTKFLTVLLGIYRISFTTLRDIDYLASFEDTGADILDLTRKIIEHGISVEYMLWKGKEETAGQFQDYLTVQMHQELELLKAIGQDPATLSDDLQIGIAQTESDYAALDKRTRERRTWAGLDFEGMLKALKEAGAIKEADSPRLLSAYVWGCRLNHPNPFVTHGYLNPEEHDAANTFYVRLGITMALAIHLRLTTRLIDESRTAVGSNIYPELAEDIKGIQDDFDRIG